MSFADEPEHVLSGDEEQDPLDPSATPPDGIDIRGGWADAMTKTQKALKQEYSDAFEDLSDSDNEDSRRLAPVRFFDNYQRGEGLLQIARSLTPEEMKMYREYFQILKIVALFLKARHHHREGLRYASYRSMQWHSFQTGLKDAQEAQSLLAEFYVTPTLEEEFPGIGTIPQQLAVLASSLTLWLDTHPEANPQRTDTPPAEPPPSA